jgi:hypothetical protein
MTSMSQPPRTLALWSAPRSRSTAFLRMMVERGDHTVLHEPFSHVVNFGSTSVAGETVRSEADLIAAIRGLPAHTPVFFKDTTDFHYPGLLADERFLREATHTFIIRHPADAIASHFALNQRLDRDEIGFARLAEIYDAVLAATGRAPVVIDSDDLVANPEGTVRAYCEAVGVDFRPHALRWDAGLRPEWRSTSRWHASTSRTEGFSAAAPRYAQTTDNNPLLAGFLAYHLPFYERLRAGRLTLADARRTMGAST